MFTVYWQLSKGLRNQFLFERGFDMSIEIVLEGQLEKEADREQFSAFLKQVCDDKKLKMEDYDTSIMIDICPEGYIECGYEDRFVSIAAQTNVAGPGFHAYVCTVFDAIISGSQIPLEVSDPTGYYTDRNFETLRYQYFYRWLKDIQGYVLEHMEEEKELCISWPQEYYHPVWRDGFVVTPMGYIHKEDFRTRDVEDLADDFFVWNDFERTARYYRNCAMVLLWKECYFTYSSMNEYTDKVANSIIDYLEAAYEKDDLLPLPMDAYRSICTAIKREILIHHANELKVANLGYRNGIVSYHFGSWSIPAHGCCEKSFDETTQTMHFMAPYKEQDEPWKWMMKANAYSFEKEIPTFLEKLENPQDVMDSFSFEKETVSCKGIVENMDEYYMVVVQANCERDTLFLECIVRDEQDVAMIKEWCQGIRHRVTLSDELHS